MILVPSLGGKGFLKYNAHQRFVKHRTQSIKTVATIASAHSRTPSQSHQCATPFEWLLQVSLFFCLQATNINWFHIFWGKIWTNPSMWPIWIAGPFIKQKLNFDFLQYKSLYSVHIFNLVVWECFKCRYHTFKRFRPQQLVLTFFDHLQCDHGRFKRFSVKSCK